MKMEIIGVNNFKDITIRFEDGTIVEHKVYSDFKSGMVGLQICNNICSAQLHRPQIQHQNRLHFCN